MSSLMLQAGATVLLADFVSGAVHWVEDAYARPGAPLIGSLAENNLRHHWRPREFLGKTWFASSWDLLLAGAILVGAALYMGWLSWHVVLFALLVINANQIHKWAHMNSGEVPIPVRWLQKLHVLQTPRHHGKHHAGSRTTHYCVISNFLNPLLEEVMFWSRVERVIERITGIKRAARPRNASCLAWALNHDGIHKLARA